MQRHLLASYKVAKQHDNALLKNIKGLPYKLDQGSESNICSAQAFTQIFINLSTQKKKFLHHAVKYNGAHIAGSKRGYFNLMMLLST